MGDEMQIRLLFFKMQHGTLQSEYLQLNVCLWYCYQVHTISWLVRLPVIMTLMTRVSFSSIITHCWYREAKTKWPLKYIFLRKNETIGEFDFEWKQSKMTITFEFDVILICEMDQWLLFPWSSDELNIFRLENLIGTKTCLICHPGKERDE